MSAPVDPAVEPNGDSATRPTILVAHDQAPNRALMRAYLGGTYEIVEAPDGATALEIVKRRPIDLVLLDVMMPHMSGFAVCRILKQLPSESYLPVILITALSQQEDSPAGGVVSAAVRQAGDEVEIEVADRGRGIPDELKDQLFKKFGSLEASRGEARRGIGLGLYLVKLVASAHGGRTEVRNREGGGTAFGLFLPRGGTAVS